MTVVNLHGILAHEFGDSFLMEIEKPKQVIDAITCNKALFKKRILELSQQGIHYSILIDGENIVSEYQLEIKKENTVIDFAPVICGRGFVTLLTAIGSALAGAGGALGVIGGALGTIGSAGWASTLIGTVLNSVAMAVIQQALAPSEKPQRTEATVSGTKESFLISSKGNLAEQGIPVPVGYGRLRVGSYIIQSTIKSYPQKYQTKKALTGDIRNNKGNASFRRN